jgi:hypothetical protein
MTRYKGHKTDFCSCGEEGLSFAGVHGFEGVVSCFRVDVRLKRGDFAIEARAGEDERDVDAAEAGDEKSAVCFVVERARRALEFANGRIAVHSNYQNVAEEGRLFKVGDVSAVEKIETTVCQNDFAPLLRSLFSAREDFVES